MRNIVRSLRYDWPLHFVLLLTNWLPDNVVFLRLRGWLAHFFFASCGVNLRLGRGLVFYNPSNIHLGKNIYIAYGNWFSASAKIKLEDEVILGPKNVFASGNHTRENGSFRYGKPTHAPIVIGKGTWIGANCVITAGSTIGSGSVVGANSVVTKDIPDNVLVAGNPAKQIKEVHD